MIGPAMDRGGLKDSENAPNSFFPKINWTVFWHLGTDMYLNYPSCRMSLEMELLSWKPISEKIPDKTFLTKLNVFTPSLIFELSR